VNVVYVDGQMCEDIRIGIAVRQAFGSGAVNKMYRRKDLGDGRGCGISMSFGSTVIECAGGFRRFLDEWEEDPRG
jgi:hypothetical protein